MPSPDSLSRPARSRGNATASRNAASAARLRPGTLSVPQSERSDFVRALAKGLAVIEAFDARSPSMTLSEVAKRTGLSRGTARRLLHTLVELGYAGFDGKYFGLQ